MVNEKLRDFISKYHVFLIIAILILGLGIIINLTTPDYSDELIKYDDFTVRIPNDAEYENITGGFIMTGPYADYEICVESSDKLSWLFDMAKSSGELVIAQEFNSTHYYLKYDCVGGLEADDFAYEYYGFIIPKKDFNNVTEEITNGNTKIIAISGSFEGMFDYTVKNIGGE